MPRVKNIPVRHVESREHYYYCPKCRVDYYSSRPGRGVITYQRKSGGRYYSGKPPSLKYLAANAVKRRNLFKYRPVKHRR